MLEHACSHDIFLGAAFVNRHLNVLGIGMRPDVYGRRVPPHEEGLAALAGLVQPVERDVGYFLVHRFHALAGERTGVFDLLFANAAEFGIGGRIIGVGGPGVQHAARTELLFVLGMFLAGIIKFFRLLLGIEVIEVAEPFIKAVHGGEEFIAVAEVVFS